LRVALRRAVRQGEQATSKISSGVTVFFFDFDIFSTSPMTIGSPVSFSRARRVLPSASISISRGSTQSPFWRR
jgi:hypothetical protein